MKTSKKENGFQAIKIMARKKDVKDSSSKGQIIGHAFTEQKVRIQEIEKQAT